MLRLGSTSSRSRVKNWIAHVPKFRQASSDQSSVLVSACCTADDSSISKEETTSLYPKEKQ